MKVKKFQLLIFIIFLTTLFKLNNCKYANFECKGLNEQEYEKFLIEFQALTQLAQGSTSLIKGNDKYVIKRVSGLRHNID